MIRIDKTGVFRPCPVFNNDLSLLSDLNDYPLGSDMHASIKVVQAKSFSVDFSEQTELASQLFGSLLKFNFTKVQLVQKMQQLKDYYGSEIVERVEQTVLEQMRQYSYLF